MTPFMHHARGRTGGRPAMALACLALLSACDIGEKESRKLGHRGTGMIAVYDQSDVDADFARVQLPTPLPPAGGSPPGPLPWRNVQVLNDISIAEFNRTMIAMSTWVAGTGNCQYCHNLTNLAADTANDGRPLYTKLVARRMLQMTRNINGNWEQHVANTGVTCYTCHRGKPLPGGLWFYGDQDDYLRHYLDRDGGRVVSKTLGPTELNRSSVKQTEWMYALMINQSKSLGVSCNYCHNSRQFASWTESPVARQKAFHGISMLRDLNANYLAPLQPLYPPVRLGPMGDAPKAQCVTCHGGAYKPLYGAQMARDYPAVWGRPAWNGVPFPSVVPSTPVDSLAVPADSLRPDSTRAPQRSASASAGHSAVVGGPAGSP